MNINSNEKKVVLDYWSKYFPELTKKELDDIIEYMGEIDYQKLYEYYEEYDETFQNNQVEAFIDFQYCELICKHKEWFEQQQMFTNYIFPIVNYQFKKICDTYYSDQLLDNAEVFWKDIVNNINLKVYQYLYKSIIFEINYLKENNQLLGENSEERMNYFIDNYSENNMNIIKFYKEYYTITKLITHVVEAEFKYVIQILEYVKKDSQEIRSKFNIDSIIIQKINLGQGDVHQGGKTVATIYFIDNKKILYKPRGMLIDKKFTELMGWLKQNVEGVHEYIGPEIISMEGYGYSKFIEYKECKNSYEVERFYERIGEILAVLYSLNSSDFHYENIIAYGEFPVLIDLETVLHPTLNDLDDIEKNSSFKKAEKKYNKSVATIGMLPTYMKGNLEVGGLGATKEQDSTFKVDFVEDSQKDSIHIVKKKCKIKIEQNNPVLNSKVVSSEKYIKEIKKGFCRVYKWITKNKNNYYKYVSNLFMGCRGRMIFRPTLYYSQLLNISLHQEFARKDYERQLIMYKVVEKKYKDYPDIISSEYLDLLQGNVPYFTFKIGETDIYDSNGNKLIQSKIVSILKEIKEKIDSFNNTDLHEQLRYIEDSYITKKNHADRTFLRWDFYNNNLQTDQWIKTAISIGEYIGENAVEGINSRGNTDSSWICVTLQGFEEDVWVPSVLPHDFYSGNAGIAYYFIYLWKITQNKYFLECAKKASEIPLTLLNRKYIDKNTTLGAFIGLGGSVYMLNALAEETNDSYLKRQIEDFLISSIDLIQYDKNNDLIGGLTGYLAVALRLARTSNRKEEFNNLITKIVDQLIQNAVVNRDKVYWNCVGGKHYSGFSHGNAGIHTYLSRAVKYIGETKYNSIIQKSLNYERTCLKKDNWIRSEMDPTVSNAWCHGSPGILLSKLMLYDMGNTNKIIQNEIELALTRTKNSGFGNNPTYCHGDLGNMAILNYAGKVLERPKLCNENMDVFQQLYQTTLSKEWKNKEYKSSNTYGLMVGLSGWGYSMLSHYADGEIPEFLWID